MVKIQKKYRKDKSTIGKPYPMKATFIARIENSPPPLLNESDSMREQFWDKKCKH